MSDGRCIARTHIYRGRRMPDGRVLSSIGWLFACPCCEYQWAYGDPDAALAGATTHCRTSGGVAHDRLLVDLLADASPLFTAAL